MARKKKGKKKKVKSGLRTTLTVFAVVFSAAILIHRIVNGKSPTTIDKSIVQLMRQSAEQAHSEPVGDLTGLVEIPARLTDRKEIILQRRGYTVSYNSDLKIPNWVAWKLTKQRLNGKAKRTDEFLPDPDLPVSARSLDSDYSGSRYDRGHMAPAGDMKWDKLAMAESFYLSNMCPQASNLNRGDWRILEEKCRDWARRGEDFYIVCGPVLKEGVKHKRIGRNKVTVPEGFFKVLLVLGDKERAVGFLYPNDDCEADLSTYAVSVDSVEAVTGIDFYASLEDDVEQRLEAENAIRQFVGRKK